MAMKRRDFLKGLTGVLSSAVILSCGDSNNGGGSTVTTDLPVIPNGYKFYGIVTSGDTLPGGKVAKELLGAVKLSDNRDLIFTVTCDDDVVRIFEYHMDFSSDVPSVASKRKVVAVGDTLSDGAVVGDPLNIGSPNKSGNYATVITTDAGIHGIYLDSDKQGLKPVVTPLDTLPDGNGNFGSSFGDVELDDTNAIFFVSHYCQTNQSQPQEGLFYLPDGKLSATGKLLASGDLLPDSNTTIARIGLIDVTKSTGEYVSQVTSGVSVAKSLGKIATATGFHPTALVSGSVHKSAARLRAASKSVVKSVAANSLVGDVLYAPRLGGPGKKVAQVLHVSQELLSLHLDNDVVAYTGGMSPQGKVIKSFSGPLIADSGLLYYLSYTEDGEELCVFDGSVSKTILEMGNKAVEGENRAVIDINFGVLRNMLDQDGRVVFVGTLEDMTRSIILGIPV